eukprot:3940969-Rhodomonas_salina.1
MPKWTRRPQLYAPWPPLGLTDAHCFPSTQNPRAGCVCPAAPQGVYVCPVASVPGIACGARRPKLEFTLTLDNDRAAGYYCRVFPDSSIRRVSTRHRIARRVRPCQYRHRRACSYAAYAVPVRGNVASTRHVGHVSTGYPVARADIAYHARRLIAESTWRARSRTRHRVVTHVTPTLGIAQHARRGIAELSTAEVTLAFDARLCLVAP